MKTRNGTMKAGRCFLLLFICVAVNFGGTPDGDKAYKMKEAGPTLKRIGV